MLQGFPQDYSFVPPSEDVSFQAGGTHDRQCGSRDARTCHCRFDPRPCGAHSMSIPRPLKMQISLNALEHLGMNLYSNVPSVLSEIVANAWDADATHVRIVLDKARGYDRH